MSRFARYVLLAVGMLTLASSAFAADQVAGQVLADGAPVAGSTVTLWAAGPGEPSRLGSSKSGPDGKFTVKGGPRAAGAVLYLVAAGGAPTLRKGSGENPAIALLAVLGTKPPAKVTVNEFTTIASVVTHNQFIDGSAIRDTPMALRIAAGNVPNFVDLLTGGFGGTIQDPLNSSQTTTMANFATLATRLAGCTTQVTADACARLFAATTSADGSVPENTLAVAEAIARNPGFQAGRLFALLDGFYPVPPGKKMRVTPFMPYLNFAPSAVA
jgi:hypothetical protein